MMKIMVKAMANRILMRSIYSLCVNKKPEEKSSQITLSFTDKTMEENK